MHSKSCFTHNKTEPKGIFCGLRLKKVFMKVSLTIVDSNNGLVKAQNKAIKRRDYQLLKLNDGGEISAEASNQMSHNTRASDHHNKREKRCDIVMYLISKCMQEVYPRLSRLGRIPPRV